MKLKQLAGGSFRDHILSDEASPPMSPMGSGAAMLATTTSNLNKSRKKPIARQIDSSKLASRLSRLQ